MSFELVGFIGIILLILVLSLGVPIAVSLGLVGSIGLAIVLSPDAAIIKLGVVGMEAITKYELGVLPLFLLMAHICFIAGASHDFFSVASRFVGHRRGGLALASIAGCAGFGAVSGSSLATVATIGSAALPEMRAANYKPGFAAGALAAGGTLGALIPPSGALIVFGIIAEQSIGKLFAAAVIPGITQALFYMLTISIMCKLNPLLAPAKGQKASLKNRLDGLVNILDIIVLVTFAIGGLLIGWFSPTEAASVGVVLSFVLCWHRGKLTKQSLKQACYETFETTGMLYLIIIGAMIFATFISATGVAHLIADFVRSLSSSPVTTIFVMALVLLVLGAFLDGLALMLLTMPIFLPIALDMGYSPIWFGIFLVRAMEIGFVMPPLGLNAYVIQSISKDIPLEDIFKGITPFIISDICHLSLIILLPAAAMWLPSMIGG